MKDKTLRQRAIYRAVGRAKISNQDELLKILDKEGIASTQATLSRDLREMKIVKMHDGSGGYYYSVPSDFSQVIPDSDASHILAGISSVEFSGQLAVVKTLPGYANMVATVLDTALDSSIMGTIAGDDTLLFALRVGTVPETVLDLIEKRVPGIGTKLI